MIKRRNNNNNRNNRNNNVNYGLKRANMQVSRNISLYSQKVKKNITFYALTTAGTTATLFSLTNGADVRFLAFSAVLASTEFTNMATVYDNFRIVSASVTVNNITRYTIPSPFLIVDVSPSETPANPTNSQIIADDSARVFGPYGNNQVCTWPLLGVGPSSNIWLDTSNPPALGSFNIGNNQSVVVTSAIWEIRFELCCEFANPK